MDSLITCLWFDGNAAEAAAYYTKLFSDSTLGKTVDGVETPATPTEGALTVNFELRGQKFMGLNGGPHFKFSEAVSLMVPCKDQDEIDYFWNTFIEDGGKASECGWLKDKFGFSWQIIPADWSKMWSNGTKAQNQAMMNEVMTMKKLEIARMDKAWHDAA